MHSQHYAFVTTQWSAVFRAGKGESGPADAAMEILCRNYWPPIYAFVRRSGVSKEEAEDITQSFFQRLIEKQFHLAADPERGRFRTFLLAALKNFLSNWQRDAGRQKRGGGAEILTLNLVGAESKLSLEIADGETPERAFHRSWANRLLERVMDRLQGEYRAAGEEERFKVLANCLDDPAALPAYAALARQLGISESGVKSAVARLRQRFRALYREEIGSLVDDPSEVDAEIRALLGAL